MSKLFSVPSKRIVLLHELPLPQFGGKNQDFAPIVDNIRADFQATGGHGFVAVHTLLDPGYHRKNGKIEAISRVLESPFPKFVFIPGNSDGDIEWHMRLPIPNERSFVVLVASGPDSPEPVPCGWDDGIAALAFLGLKVPHLFGYEGRTLPFDLWDAWYSRRRDAEEVRIHSVISEFLREHPELKSEPVLHFGCILNAYLAFLERRKQYGLDVLIEHELLNPGLTKGWTDAARKILSREGLVSC